MEGNNFSSIKCSRKPKNVEAILIEQYPDEFLQGSIRVDALSKMNHLELLILWNVNCFGTLNGISNELRYLYWSKFPWMSLPPTFHPDQLVELIMRHSNIKRLWEGKKVLYVVGFYISLSRSKRKMLYVIFS